MSNTVLYLVALVIVLVVLLIHRSRSQSMSKMDSILLFYRDGCPYCEVFKPEWQKIEKLLGERAKKFNTADPKVANLASQYKVSGVPSIILLDKEGRHENYFGTRNADNIMLRFY